MPEAESHPASQPPKPVLSAPGLGELFEQSLTAIVDPSVFRRAAARPAPSFAAAGGLALAAGAAALAAGFAHAAVSSPGLLQRLSPPFLAAVGVAVLGLYTGLLLLFSAMLYGIGNGFGGKGEFERGLQAAAMISVLAPLQMLCNWFPAAWIAPALLAAWVSAGALEGLFNAHRGPARALCVLLAAGAIGLQAAVRAAADRARDAYAAVEAVKEASLPGPDLGGTISALTQQAQTAADATASAPSATSGLDLLRGPTEGGGSVPQAQPPFGAPAQFGPAPAGRPSQGAPAPDMRTMEATAAGMLDAMTPMLNMLTSSRALGPQQRADVKELQNLMRDLKTQMATGKQMDNVLFAKKMARYQALLMKVMPYSMTPSSPAGAAR